MLDHDVLESLRDESGSILFLSLYDRIAGIEIAPKFIIAGKIKEQFAVSITFSAEDRTIGANCHCIELIRPFGIVRTSVYGKIPWLSESFNSSYVIRVQFAEAVDFACYHVHLVADPNPYGSHSSHAARLSQHDDFFSLEIEFDKISIVG
ncbi:MAG TPA: hypothetical protein DEP53_08200 [Bacteroidetes bacterium]|nr:hypothetical protein [Bacteroidota bacterium]